MIAPCLWEMQGNSLESPLSSQSVSGMVCGAKACTEIFGLPWGTLGFIFSPPPSCSLCQFVCYSILLLPPMPGAFPYSQAGSMPLISLRVSFSPQICARQSSCVFVVEVPCFRMALLATSSGGQAAESMAERFVWPVSLTEIAFWETPPVNLLNLIPGYRNI